MIASSAIGFWPSIVLNAVRLVLHDLAMPRHQRDHAGQLLCRRCPASRRVELLEASRWRIQRAPGSSETTLVGGCRGLPANAARVAACDAADDQREWSEQGSAGDGEFAWCRGIPST
jgi:hypothetical protein